MLFLPTFPNQAIVKGLIAKRRNRNIHARNENKNHGRQNELQLLERISTPELPI